MKKLPLSKFNEDETFSEDDIMKMADVLNDVNIQLHDYSEEDLDHYMAMVYEVGAMLISQVMSCIENRDDMLADMLNDVQEDLVSYLDFHDQNHRPNNSIN